MRIFTLNLLAGRRIIPAHNLISFTIFVTATTRVFLVKNFSQRNSRASCPAGSLRVAAALVPVLHKIGSAGGMRGLGVNRCTARSRNVSANLPRNRPLPRRGGAVNSSRVNRIYLYRPNQGVIFVDRGFATSFQHGKNHHDCIDITRLVEQDLVEANFVW